MGKFIYGMPSIEVDMDDRVLAHVKAVITSKLRRSESFTFTYRDDDGGDPSHSSVWLDPAIPLKFEIAGKQDPPLNRDWLEVLSRSANSVSGLTVVPEPTPST